MTAPHRMMRWTWTWTSRPAASFSTPMGRRWRQRVRAVSVSEVEALYKLFKSISGIQLGVESWVRRGSPRVMGVARCRGIPPEIVGAGRGKVEGESHLKVYCIC